MLIPTARVLPKRADSLNSLSESHRHRRRASSPAAAALSPRALRLAPRGSSPTHGSPPGASPSSSFSCSLPSSSPPLPLAPLATREPLDGLASICLLLNPAPTASPLDSEPYWPMRAWHVAVAVWMPLVSPHILPCRKCPCARTHTRTPRAKDVTQERPTYPPTNWG